MGKRNRSLDTLRGIAILGVLAVHTSQAVSSGVRQVDALLGWGRFGVQLFFLVSAFTMCYMWHERAGESERVRKFYIRRVLRIAPMFWLAIPVYLLLYGTGTSYWSPQGISALDIALTATFLHGWWPPSINAIVPGGWSIAVEMMFYLLFPFLILRIEKPASFLLAAVVVYAANKLVLQPALMAALAAHFPPGSEAIVNNFLSLNPVNQLPVLLVGCHLFHVFDRPPAQAALHAGLGVLAWPAVAGALQLLDVADLSWGLVFSTSLLYLLAFLVLRHRLGWQPLETLGRYSYGVYLSEFAVLLAVGKVGWDPGLPSFAAALGLTLLGTLLLAYGLHLAVERPSSALARRWTSLPSRRPVAA